jgi:hypothetical protein
MRKNGRRRGHSGEARSADRPKRDSPRGSPRDAGAVGIEVEEAAGQPDAMKSIAEGGSSNARYWAILVSTAMASIDWETLAR